MSESAKPKGYNNPDIPVIFIPKNGSTKARQRMVEELIIGLLQNEDFLQTLQENRV